MNATANPHRPDSVTRHHNRYYNPTIGRWMSEDPIAFDGGDVNLNRFVGNQPTTLADPTGTTSVTRLNDVRTSAGLSINPTSRAHNLMGSNWNFHWQVGDLPGIVQRVNNEGTFYFVDSCGLTSIIRWREQYVELWVAGGRAQGRVERDHHNARPKKPADALLKAGGWTIREKDHHLFIKKKDEEREILAWGFFLEAQFELANAWDPAWPQNAGNNFSSKSDFEITNLILEGKTVFEPKVQGFTTFLNPNLGGIPNAVPAPENIRGGVVTAKDRWFMNWTEGDRLPSWTYSTTGYK